MTITKEIEKIFDDEYCNELYKGNFLYKRYSEDFYMPPFIINTRKFLEEVSDDVVKPLTTYSSLTHNSCYVDFYDEFNNRLTFVFMTGVVYFIGDANKDAKTYNRAFTEILNIFDNVFPSNERIDQFIFKGE